MIIQIFYHILACNNNECVLAEYAETPLHSKINKCAEKYADKFIILL